MSDPTPEEVKKAKEWVGGENPGSLPELLHSHAEEAVKARDQEWTNKLFGGPVAVMCPDEAATSVGRAVEAATEELRREIRLHDESAEEYKQYAAGEILKEREAREKAEKEIAGYKSVAETMSAGWDAARAEVERLKAAEKACSGVDHVKELQDLIEQKNAAYFQVDGLSADNLALRKRVSELEAILKATSPRSFEASNAISETLASYVPAPVICALRAVGMPEKITDLEEMGQWIRDRGVTCEMTDDEHPHDVDHGVVCLKCYAAMKLEVERLHRRVEHLMREDENGAIENARLDEARKRAEETAAQRERIMNSLYEEKERNLARAEKAEKLAEALDAKSNHNYEQACRLEKERDDWRQATKTNNETIGMLAALAEVARLKDSNTYLQDQADGWRRNYFDVVNALGMSSVGVNEAVSEVTSLRKRVEELEAELGEDTDEAKLLRKIREDSNEAIKEALGLDLWNRLWGPELEAIGRIVDAALLGREQARREGAEEMRERAARLVDDCTPSGCGAAEEIRALPTDPPTRPITRCAVLGPGLSLPCGNPMPCPTHYPDPPKARPVELERCPVLAGGSQCGALMPCPAHPDRTK